MNYSDDEDDDRMSPLVAFCLGLSLGAFITLSILFLASNIQRVEHLHRDDPAVRNRSQLPDLHHPAVWPGAPDWAR